MYRAVSIGKMSMFKYMESQMAEDEEWESGQYRE